MTGVKQRQDNNKTATRQEGDKTMRLEEARIIAERVRNTLAPYCNRIAIAGSIRRYQPIVHDIDIVLIEKPQQELTINSLIASIGEVELNGEKIKRLWYGDKNSGVSIDIYIATKETWATLLLIRTGSKESNIRLCTIARRKGWKLKANGDGLFDNNGNRIAGDSEASIYKALDIKYQTPEERR